MLTIGTSDRCRLSDDKRLALLGRGVAIGREWVDEEEVVVCQRDG